MYRPIAQCMHIVCERLVRRSLTIGSEDAVASLNPTGENIVSSDGSTADYVMGISLAAIKMLSALKCTESRFRW